MDERATKIGHGAKSSNRLQFRLAHMLIAVAFLSVCCALIAWRLALGLLLSLAMVGIVSAGFGYVYRRKSFVAPGLIVVGVVGAILLVDVCVTIMWTGSVDLKFDVKVIDDEDGAPIAEAEVFFANDEWNPSIHVADANGRVTFTQNFPCGGSDSYLGITRSTTGDFPLRWYYLTARADGYSEVEANLSDLLGRDVWNWHDEDIPPIVIRLRHNESQIEK